MNYQFPRGRKRRRGCQKEHKLGIFRLKILAPTACVIFTPVVPTQLPSKTNCITLNGGKERVFTIKNHKGDWIAVKGRWSGFKLPKKGEPGTSNTKGTPGRPGNPGYLDLHIYHNTDQLEMADCPPSKKDPQVFQE